MDRVQQSLVSAQCLGKSSERLKNHQICAVSLYDSEFELYPVNSKRQQGVGAFRDYRIQEHNMAKGKTEGADVEKKMSKRKMVEIALSDLGDVGPKELYQHILDKFKAEVTTQIISSYKSQILAGKGGKGSTSLAGGSVDLRDVVAVKDLITRIGANQLSSLIKALSK